MFSQFEALNIKALKELTEQHQVKVLPFPPEVLKELKRLTAETLAEEAQQDETFNKVYQAYQRFQADYATWNAIADDAYAQALQP
jgi:TRAP-type mannitol/chloroaromatic compound transport system substrate-binding protein